MVEKAYLVPKNGEVITWSDGYLDVPFHPIIPYIRGDGIGVDITPVMQKVIDAAIEKAYDDERFIAWMKLLAGDEALEVNRISKTNLHSIPLTEQQELYLPKKTVEMIRKYLVAIKGPLSTPIGGGIRSLNVTLRQTLDLYACVRPARWYQGVPAPLKNPERLNTSWTFLRMRWG
jgi:isocitrate dehydrogenase